MFDLEQKISDWRAQMLAAGIKSPVPLEELEIHLRDEIERQKSGLSEQMAFEISTQQIGQPKTLDCEFKKSERTFMKRNAQISAGVIGILAGVGLMVPGFIQLRNELAVADDKLTLFLLGWALIGMSAVSLQRLIRPKLFKGEFEQVKMTPLKQTLKIGAGMVVTLISLAFLMPPTAQAAREGSMRFEDLAFLVLGITLLITGALVAFCPYKKRAA
ncbi:MAG TPA: hypothetical protein VIK62_04305 [Verrucomicrobiae bacterium]